MLERVATLALGATLVAPPPVEPGGTQAKQPSPPPVVLVVNMDDVGAHDVPASEMPSLDHLRQAGVSFERAYAHPWCAPTRDTLLFGRWRGQARGDLCVGYERGKSHEPGEPSLMRAMEDAGWETWMVGKWHRGNAPRPGIGWEEGPLFWWDHWLMGTAYSSTVGTAAECQDPLLWMYPAVATPSLVVNDGFLSMDARYDLAREFEALLDAISRALASPEPDLIYFAPQAAHSPWVTPPSWMLPPGYQSPGSPTEVDLYREERMALDFVIGEAVRAVGPDAWVVVLGDNGPPAAVDTDGLRGSKLSPYEGGIRVPLVLYGPGILPGRVTEPVHVLDVGKTLLVSLVLEARWHEGQDLSPLMLGLSGRGWAACSRGATIRDRAVVEQRYKLIRFEDGSEEMYDLLLDPQETAPLALAGPDYRRLARRMERVFP